jgi:hypothetical protein
MFKASVAIHKAPDGAVSAIACSENADDVVSAYNACNDAGEVQLIIRGRLQKQKKVVGAKLPKKKPTKKAAK